MSTDQAALAAFALYALGMLAIAVWRLWARRPAGYGVPFGEILLLCAFVAVASYDHHGAFSYVVIKFFTAAAFTTAAVLRVITRKRFPGPQNQSPKSPPPPSPAS